MSESFIPCWHNRTWHQLSLKNECAHCEIEHARQLLERWVTACQMAAIPAVSADLRDNPLLALIADCKAYLRPAVHNEKV